MNSFLFQFYHPQAVFKKKPLGCPDGYPYQPYKKTYPNSYVCDYSPLIMLNISIHPESAEGFAGMIVFYFLAVVLLNLVPIFLNVAFSVKVLFEVKLYQDCSLQFLAVVLVPFDP